MTTKRTGCLALATVVSLGFVAIAPAGASIKPNQTLANITIGESVASVALLPVYTAQANGYFTQNGLNTKVVVLSAATTTAALVSNSVQLNTGGVTTFLQARASGTPIEAVATYAIGNSTGLIISTAFAAAHGITAKTPMATVAKDMVGSVGGSSAAVETGYIDLMLRSFGVSASQVSIATLSSTAADEAAVQKGQISWFSTNEPVPFELQAQGLGLVVGTPQNVPAWHQKQMSQLLVADTTFANANPGLIRKAVLAIQEGSKYVHLHAQKALPIALAQFPGVSRTTLFNSYRYENYPVSVKMNANLWRSTVAFSVKSGQITGGTKVTENVDWTNKFI